LSGNSRHCRIVGSNEVCVWRVNWLPDGRGVVAIIGEKACGDIGRD